MSRKIKMKNMTGKSFGIESQEPTVHFYDIYKTKR